MNKGWMRNGAWILLSVAPVVAAAEESAHVEEIVVRAHPLSGERLAQPLEVIAGDELARALDTSIGAVVARRPGIATTFYGQAVGRPVIHGLGGSRVRVLEDRIGTLDASVASDDHAVTVEPFMADEIEILKGPATLLYGSGAIGGVVDVHTGRIPHEQPDRALTGRAQGRLDDVADQRTGALRLDGGVGNVAWHASGFTRRLNDYEIPGYAESAALRALEEEHDHEDHEEEEDHGEAHDEAHGVLDNSDLRTRGGSLGLSLIGERGFIGVAGSRYRSEYGLPGGGHAHDEAAEDPEAGEHDEAEGDVRLDVRQDRWDFEVGLEDPLPRFTGANVRVGVNDYSHVEIEGDGGIGTVFSVKAWEARTELLHEPIGAWTGAVGFQAGREKFSAIGEEAFTPPSETDTLALFVLEERPFDDFSLQLGGRYERTDVEADGMGDERFDTFSGSAGIVVPFADAWRAALQADYANRAPTAAELYSDGPHLATQSFELGDPQLDPERALNLSLSLHYSGERLRASGTLYHSRFRDFIYQADLGIEEDGLPVRQWSQQDARFTGLDLEARWAWLVDAPLTVDLRVFHDRVQGELDVSGNDHIPRITPDRAGIGVAARWQRLTATIDYMRVMRQRDTAAFELPTDAYNDLRVHLAAGFGFGGSELTVFVEGRNLTDAEQRNHVSYLKDLAPLPGRTLLAGLRATF